VHCLFDVGGWVDALQFDSVDLGSRASLIRISKRTGSLARLDKDNPQPSVGRRTEHNDARQ